MSKPERLKLGTYYHIFNRGTNGEVLFHQEQDYWRFLQCYIRYVEPVAETHAYCLMGNHFHLAIRTRTDEEQSAFLVERDGAQNVPAMSSPLLDPSHQFSLLFSAYAKWFNARYRRTGSLFEHPFERKPVTTDAYYWKLIAYIHRNPQRHGFVGDFRGWPWSSYGTVLSSGRTRLSRDAVLAWFGGRETFVAAHERDDDLPLSLQLD